MEVLVQLSQGDCLTPRNCNILLLRHLDHHATEKNVLVYPTDI